jgi:hypothetical protein
MFAAKQNKRSRGKPELGIESTSWDGTKTRSSMKN